MMKFRVLDIKDLSADRFEKAFERMSGKRQERCLRYKFMDDRRRMAFSEELLKGLVSEVYKVPETEITLENLPSGKPVAYVDGKEVFVSITHSGDFVAAAVSDTSVGIDLEVKKELKPSVFKALSKEELEYAEKSKDKNHTFLRIWTAKEAYLKLTGEGLKGFSKANVLPLVKNGKWDGLVLKANHTDQYFLTVIYER